MNSYKLLGRNISYSISPEIHSYTYKLLGLNAKYEIFDCDDASLTEFLASLKKSKSNMYSNCKGMNVTIPYKEKVISLLDELDNNSCNIGSVNTIKVNNNRLYGYNTDYYGIECTLDKSVIFDNNHLILGTGGASKPLIHYLISNGAKRVYIASRNPETLEHTFKDPNTISKIEIISYNTINNISGSYIINATPVGTYPNIYESPVAENVFINFTHAFDLTYNPSETLFLKYAKNSGLDINNGLKMLVYQALNSIEIWNDLIIKEDLKKEIYNHFYLKSKMPSSIYLIGITGVGKTTIGKLLAERLGYNFIDIDEEIEKKTGQSITYLFSKGEDNFRRLEKDFLYSTSKLKNTIISTGGGIITSEDNRIFLDDKFIIHLDRPIDNIIKSIDIINRPLLKNNLHHLRTLYNQRLKYYRKLSSITINNIDIEAAIDEIMIKLYEDNKYSQRKEKL